MNHQGHRERVRARFLSEGLKNFKPHSVVEMMLMMLIPYKNVTEIADDLLEKFGNLTAIFNAPVPNLMQIDGINRVTAINIKFIGEFLEYYYLSKKDDLAILSTADIYDYSRYMLDNSKNECLFVVCLDSSCKIVGKYEYKSDNQHQVIVNFKELIEKILNVGAVKVFVAHSHLLGNCAPSQKDISFTRRLFIALNALDVALVEHTIFGIDGSFSFYANGLLDEFRQILAKL
ncbi:MAG: JAB domain-containing protein [Clostridia bacterium]